MRVILLLTALLLIQQAAVAQKTAFNIPAPKGFEVDHHATASHNPFTGNYHLVTQQAKNILHRLYNDRFELVCEYESESPDITFSERRSPKANYFAPLCTRNGYYELFGTSNGVLVYKPDFENKKDSLVRSFSYNWVKKSGLKLISVMPDTADLKLFTYSKEKNAFVIYKWIPGEDSVEYVFNLPEKFLTKEEEKSYPDCQSKYKFMWDIGFPATQLGIIQPMPKSNTLLYKGDQIYLILGLRYSMGQQVIHIDLGKQSIDIHNYFINSYKDNTGTFNNIKKNMVSILYDSTLIIQNSSIFRFEYLFYNIKTHALIKKYSVLVEDSLYRFMHSSLTQKGTYGSAKQEKDITREKAFMRKVNGSFGFINIAAVENDSIVLTLSDLKETEGIGGTLLSAVTMSVGFMANIHIGNLQLVPYLTSRRYKLFFAHSVFNKNTWEPAPGGNRNITTLLDTIIDTFENMELSGSSSFLIEKHNEILIGVLNTEKNTFDIHSFKHGSHSN